MFLAGRKPKTTVFSMFFASGSKNHGVYSVFWPAPSKNTRIYAGFTMLQDVVSIFRKGQKDCKLQCFGSAPRVLAGRGGGAEMTSNLLNNQVTGLAALPFTS